jgi:uncharacterized protein YbaR (Trm112 family)
MPPALRHLSNPNSLSSVLACPRCRRGPITLERAGWMCGGCSSGYPVIGEIPWLFPEPRQALTEWRGRLNLLTQHLATEATAMRASLQRGDLPAGARRRLEHVAKANEDQIQRLRVLLAPLGLEQASIAEATHRGLGTRLPTEQGLTNYYVNLHRDWAWGDEENQAALQELRALLGAGVGGLGHTLVQGAGAGRLAYDLHGAGDAPLTVATDFNPLLLFAARELYAGRTVELYEYPIAPRRIEDYAVLRRLSAPAPARDGLMLVAADALQPPFADGAFDTVVTPWFIDIIRRAVHTCGGAHQSVAEARRALDQLRFAGVRARGACGTRESRRGDRADAPVGIHRFHGARRFDAVHAFPREPACAHREYRLLGH